LFKGFLGAWFDFDENMDCEKRKKRKGELSVLWEDLLMIAW